MSEDFVEDFSHNIPETIKSGLQAGGVSFWELKYPEGVFTFHSTSEKHESFKDSMADQYSTLLDKIHPQDTQRVREAVDSHLNGEAGTQKLDITFRTFTEDGTVEWFRVAGKRTDSEETDTKRMNGIFISVTDKHRTKQELREKNKELVLLNQLIRHDIKNQSNIVTGWLQTVLDSGEFNKKAISNALNAGEQINEMTSVVSHILKAIQENKTELSPTPIVPQIKKSIEHQQSGCPQANFSLEVDVEDVEVVANEALISVFDNIIGNAVTHNPSSQPTISIEVKSREETVGVKIEDNGAGLPDDIHTALEGDWVDKKTLREEGTGMYIIASLIDAYGGDFTVIESNENGTTLKVTLQKASSTHD